MKTIDFKRGAWSVMTFILSLTATAQGFGEIRGIIKDTDLEPVPFATVKIVQGNRLIGGTQTDAEGAYKYKPLEPGSYEIVVMEAGHQTQQINKIKVVPNEATYVDVKLSTNTFSAITVTAKPIDFTNSGVDRNMYIMKSIDSKELMQIAGYNSGNIQDVLKYTTSEVIETGGEVHVRGARGEATGYFVDGVRTLGATNVPGLCVENLTFFSGGVPAMYGDLTSGAVIVTTKSYFTGIRDKEMRNRAMRESREEKKALEKAKLEEEKRKKEIEKEKQQGNE